MSARRSERIEDAEHSLLNAFAGLQSSIWTALPAIVRKVNLSAQTLEAEPTIQARITKPDQTTEWVTLPLMVDVPILFPSGGGFTLTFPIAVGDECLLVFASRCIDAWWQLGGVQIPPDFRIHDLSDAFALIGPRSQPRVLSSVSSTDVVLRNDSGTTSIAITASGDISIVTPTNLNITAANLNITADISTTGTLTNNGVDVGSPHRHPGVRAGADISGTPI
jgi:hypothetical protein